MSNLQRAQIYRENYAEWKKEALLNSGFFPVFQIFKEEKLLSELSGNAVKLYIYLGLQSGNLTGECWPTIETLSKYFKKTPRTISSWLEELEEKNLIRRLQFKPNDVSHTFLLPYGVNRLKEDKGE
ncbi:helix-turn-helix domain-containing protein [Paenibacillus sp. FSL L8-0696]|uniref:helix-turn-helix domain-containing protein n=1 Tax=unclassified Paenibacillus TaxID=185978 RepID=UPI0030F8FB33